MDSDPPQWIVIPNWDKFQHYRDRNPAWIKTYTELLHNEAYLDLTGHQRAVLHGLWIEYAISHARIRLNTRSLTSRLRLRVSRRTIESLNHAGFIEFSASKPLARCSIEKEREKERSSEEQKPSSPYETLRAFILNGGAEYTDPVLEDEIAVQERKRGALTEQQRTELIELAHQLRASQPTAE